MKKRIVEVNGRLALALPAETIRSFKLKKGQFVDVEYDARSGAVFVRPRSRPARTKSHVNQP
jgi:bifunctional DNA-binding transcriptional regulator/antitoxin component of YhaV-PrlF toxin-antitoxin module